jgi:hypothetical protein
MAVVGGAGGRVANQNVTTPLSIEAIRPSGNSPGFREFIGSELVDLALAIYQQASGSST